MLFTIKTIKKKNLFILIDRLINYEKEYGVEFDENGFPIFNKEDYVEELPKTIIPYSHRKDTENKSNVIVCFYEQDKNLYRKLTFDNLTRVSHELNAYKGFVGYDLSVFRDFVYPFQKFYILANLVISKFLVLGGNKMIPNLRADETDGKSYFYLFNNAQIVCCGTLGCSKYKELKYSNKLQIDTYCDEHVDQVIIQYGSKLSNKRNAILFKSYGRKKVITNG